MVLKKDIIKAAKEVIDCFYRNGASTEPFPTLPNCKKPLDEDEVIKRINVLAGILNHHPFM